MGGDDGRAETGASAGGVSLSGGGGSAETRGEVGGGCGAGGAGLAIVCLARHFESCGWGREGIPQRLKPRFFSLKRGPRLKPWVTQKQIHRLVRHYLVGAEGLEWGGWVGAGG